MLATSSRRCWTAIAAAGSLFAGRLHAQGTSETTVFLVPSARTAPSGTPSFGTAVRSHPDSGQVVVPLGLVFGLGRSLEAGVRLDDVFSAPAASDTSGLQGTFKWRIVETWHWRLAFAAFAWSPLSQQGTDIAYGGGGRISWAGQRSALTVAADAWSRGGTEIGLALEHTLGGRGVAAIEAQKRGDASEGVLSLRSALGDNATVAVGAGARHQGTETTPVVRVAIGIVPRRAYLVARPPRPSGTRRADAGTTRPDTTRAVPDLAAVVARQQAEDSLERSRVVTPVPAGVVSATVTGPVIWRWRPSGDVVAPGNDEVRTLADGILGLRCPETIDAGIERGAGVGSEQAEAVRRLLHLFGIVPDRVGLLVGGGAAADEIVVRLTRSPRERCELR